MFEQDLIKESWKKIAPFWPLENLIAVNPIKGFEHLPIEDALLEGAAFFEQEDLPTPMKLVNIQTIKWLQAFFDEGQATIEMPLRTRGLYQSWKTLAYFDKEIHGNDAGHRRWLSDLSESPDEAIAECLSKLNIPREDHPIFLTLMLTTLPGWASYIKYRNDWTDGKPTHPRPVSGADYLAMRLIMTCLLWPEAADLVKWHQKSKEDEAKKTSPLKAIRHAETTYLLPLLTQLAAPKKIESKTPEAQLVFCIDVRSEAFRRALESKGHYETFGFAGFFGLPVCINNTITEESYASCPVLLQPKHTVSESPNGSTRISDQVQKGYKKINGFKALYQSLKYNLATPFALVELLGFVVGFWMAFKTIWPNSSLKLRRFVKRFIRPHVAFSQSLENISFPDQCRYGETALSVIGLTKNFAPLVAFCGHGSSTQNNAYATALDCGACGGREGASNARILASILNTEKVRDYLEEKGIIIPKSTLFLAAKHDTTTDEFEIYDCDSKDIDTDNKIQKLKEDLKKAGKTNSHQRSKNMGFHGNESKSAQHTKTRSMDWAQVRPEWGLARNASFIVGPREISKNLDLDGRAFLHSYDYRGDSDGAILTLILTAPMIVAQWINSQYLFSTLDNVAYGAGSKITKNITGKMGIMQGNASDLMNGLPLQSVFKTDQTPYHEPVRLMTIIFAPRSLIDQVIESQPVLQNLFRNGWVIVTCIDPAYDHRVFFLTRDLDWSEKAPERF